MPSEPPPIDPAWLDRILRRFADGTLPPSEFGHRAHLVIALSHARSFGDDALVILRAALREYLMRHAGDTRAYHETMTAAWLRLIDVFDRPHRTLALVEAAARLVARFPDKHALAAHYTTERLMSDAARARWLDPDLAPLPGRYCTERLEAGRRIWHNDPATCSRSAKTSSRP